MARLANRADRSGLVRVPSQKHNRYVFPNRKTLEIYVCTLEMMMMMMMMIPARKKDPRKERRARATPKVPAVSSVRLRKTRVSAPSDCERQGFARFAILREGV